MPLWLRRVAALLELVGVFVTGTLVARMAGRTLGIPTAGVRDLAPGATIDYLALAGSTAANLLLRYGAILGLAFAVGWWHRRRSAATYGVATAGLPLRAHLTIAALLFAAGGFLPKLLIFAKDYVPLGEGPPHWDLLRGEASLEYWIYMAVGSFVLVPIVEELFARGYVQTRLAEDFGAPAAIVMTAVMFTLSHRQYFIASALGVGMLVSLLFGSLLGGHVRYRFGTLWPGVLAHALGNVPVRGWWQPVLLAAMVVVLIAGRKAVLEHLREMTRTIASRSVLSGVAIAAGVVAVILLLAAVAPGSLLMVGIVTLAAALVMEWQETRCRAGH